MNALKKNIFEQPNELIRVLKSLITERKEDALTIAALINSSSKIVLTSMGSAYYSLLPMYYYLVRYGYHVEVQKTSELMNDQDHLEKDTLYVLMSRSGESYEISEFPLLLKKVAANCVSITMTPDSTMAKLSTHVLYDCSSYDDLVCTKAYTTLALCGLVCASYAVHGNLSEQEINELILMFNWMDQNKEIISQKFASLKSVIGIKGVYCLSRSFGLGIVESASLWIEEEAKICCSRDVIDNFYHGPVEVITSDILPVFLDISGNDRSAMIWDCISQNSNRALCLCPEGSFHSSYMIHYPRFQIEPEYYSLLLALYFQLLAFYCAEGAGNEPGTFSILKGWVVK